MQINNNLLENTCIFGVFVIRYQKLRGTQIEKRFKIGQCFDWVSLHFLKFILEWNFTESLPKVMIAVKNFCISCFVRVSVTNINKKYLQTSNLQLLKLERKDKLRHACLPEVQTETTDFHSLRSYNTNLTVSSAF